MTVVQHSLYSRIRERCHQDIAPQYLDLSLSDQAFTADGSQLLVLADLIGASLQSYAPGQFVVLLLDRCNTFMPTFWGCLKAGKTALPLPIAAASNRPLPHELDQIVELMAGLGPVTVVVDEHTQASPDWFPAHLELCWLNWSTLLTAKQPPLITSDEADFPFVIQTSGTTGTAKLAAFTGRIPNSQRKNNGRRVLTLFPLSSSTGIGFAYAKNALSAYLPLTQAIRNPKALLDAIEIHRLQVLMMPPVMVQSLLRLAEEDSESDQPPDLSSLTRVNLGSSTISLEAVEKLDALLQQWGARPGLIHFAYGLTETGGVAFGPFKGVSHHDHPEGVKIGTIDSDVEVLIDAEYSGEPGLIKVRRPFSFVGYIRVEENSGWFLQPFTSGEDWFETGDLGVLDGTELVLCGRIKDTISLNSRKISLATVERYLLLACEDQFQEVVACAGPEEQLLVVLVPSTDTLISLNQLKQIITVQLINQFGLPLHELVVTKSSELPRTSTGKILKRLLVERWMASRLDQKSSPHRPLGSHDGSTTVLTLLEVEIRKHVSIPHALDPSQHLSTLGIDSLSFAQIIGSVERTTGSICLLDQCPLNPRLEDLALLFDCTPKNENFQEKILPGKLLVDLSRYPHRPSIAEQIRAANLHITGESVSPDHVVRRLNPDAVGKPIVLIGRLSARFVQEVASLLPEFPVFYLRLLEDYESHSNHNYLCGCYVDWLEAALPQCNPILVGVCLAGVLTLDVARQLYRREHPACLTVLMDWNVGRDKSPEIYTGLCAYHIHQYYWKEGVRRREEIEAELREHTPELALIYWAAARQKDASIYMDQEATPEILMKILNHHSLKSVLTNNG